MNTKWLNIITHWDWDWVIRAASSIRNWANKDNVIITQPFLLAKTPPLTAPTIITDIALDNKDPQAVLEWIDKNKSNIAYIIDHHTWWEAIADVIWDKYIIDTTAPSCPQFMLELWMDIPHDWVMAANACDRPTEFENTYLSSRYNNAFKVALVNLQSWDRKAVEEVQKAFIQELVSWEENMFITQKVIEYPVIMEQTQKAASSYEEISSWVNYVNAWQQSSIDLTALLLEWYKKWEISVVQVVSATDGKDITVVATNNKSRDLVKEFSLWSWAPFRIILTEGSHKEQLEKVVNVFNK